MEEVKQILAIAVLCGMLVGCAKEIAPPGGPADKTPPTISASNPRSGDTLVDRNASITIDFSERIDRKSVGNVVFISPPLSPEPRLRVKGSRLVIEPAAPLDSNRTYVVTIGASLSDIPGNRLTNSATIAFSTGAQIDSGTIAGRVWDKFKALPNFRVFAYPYRETLADSLFSLTPDYMTESGADGRFRFAYMREGEYLIVGVEDKDRDNKISGESERIAMPAQIVAAIAPHAAMPALDWHVSRYDSTRLELITATGVVGQITIRVAGQALDPATVIRDSIFITDTLGAEIAIDAAIAFASEGDRIHLFAEQFTEGKSLRFEIRGLRGTEGKRAEDDKLSGSVSIRGLDVEAPIVVERRPAGAVATIYPHDTLRMFFSEPVAIGEGAAWVEVDSVTRVPMSMVGGVQTSWSFAPSREAPYDRKLKFHFELDSVVDRFGNRGPDSTLKLDLSYASPESLGSVSGTITAPEAAQIIFSGASRKIIYTLDGQSSGQYSLKMYPDLYTVSAFVDASANRRWDFGSLLPLRFAERGWVLSDTLRVRARFDIEDYNLEFK